MDWRIFHFVFAMDKDKEYSLSMEKSEDDYSQQFQQTKNESTNHSPIKEKSEDLSLPTYFDNKQETTIQIQSIDEESMKSSKRRC